MLHRCVMASHNVMLQRDVFIVGGVEITPFENMRECQSI